MTKHTALAIYDLSGEIQRTIRVSRRVATLSRIDYLNLLSDLPAVLRDKLADLPMVQGFVTIRGQLLVDLCDYKRKALCTTDPVDAETIRRILRVLVNLYK